MPPIEIPKHVGVILLPDCTLFPNGLLPLHIFEPRYREMLTEALKGLCIFCVASLTGDESPEPAECTAPIGTAGLIRASHELPDGRSELLVQGICRVRFRDWLPERPFPYADIKPVVVDDIEGPEAAPQRARLLDAVEEILVDYPEEMSAQTRTLFDRSESLDILADTVAHQLVEDSALRQTLLEEIDLATRIDLIVDYLRNASLGLS